MLSVESGVISIMIISTNVTLATINLFVANVFACVAFSVLKAVLKYILQPFSK